MAYPVVESESAGSANASATTSHTITLPATVSVGARLVAALVCSVNDGTTGGIFTWPAGWTELIDAYQNEWFGVAMSAGWRIADGTEDGGTVTVTSTVTQRSAHKSWSITGGDTVYASTTVGVDGSATSNPPSFSPSPGSKEYLWLAISGIDSYRAVSTYPASYANTGYKQSAATSFDNDSTIAWARYTTTAATEDPAAFTWDSADSNMAFVLAIPPTVLTPSITSVSQIYPGGLVTVVMADYASAPLAANCTLNGVGITLEAGASTTGCTFYVPAESAFLFGGAHSATRFNTNYTLTIANASDTANSTVQVTPLSSDQIAARSADALVNPIDGYNGGLTVAASDDVYQYSDPADSFTPYPATNDFTPLEPAFTLYTKFYDVSAGSWSGLTTQAFPAEAPPGGGTLEITSTLIAQNPPGSLTPSEVDLTAFGGLDWYKTARTTTQTFDTKSGGSMIAAPANIGTPAWARDTGDSVGHPLVTWTDGAELGTHTGDRSYDYTTVNGAGQRFTISPAGALVKIYFWAGGYNAADFDVDVSFSDSSATPVTVNHVTGSSVHEQYRYEITAQPAGGAATIQLDFTKNAGQLVGWQAITVESGTSGAVYSLTSSDTTVTPGQTITATLVGGPFTGAITAAYAVYGEHEIPLIWDVLSPTTTSVTLPALSQFAQGLVAEYLPWYANFTIRIEAGEESADSPNTNQMVAPVAGDYGTVTAPPWGHPPSGAQEGDKAFVEIVSGAGTATPETFDFTESEPSMVYFYAFNEAAQRWLIRGRLDDVGVVQSVIYSVIKSILKSVVK